VLSFQNGAIVAYVKNQTKIADEDAEKPGVYPL